jgi:hypothetical protein
MSLKLEPVLTLLLASALLLGCKAFDKAVSNAANTTANTNSTTAKANTSTSEGEPDEDGYIPSGTGTEKEKPAAGKGNVQGKAMYNEQPAVGVEVKLCKTFSQFLGGCSGETFKAKTDAAGEYLIKDVPPGEYQGLTVQVFNTPYYVFARSGVLSAAKYKIEADETYFAPDTHLFKNDLKVTNPKAGSKVAPEGIEIKWDAYPDAAYYKMSVNADSSTGAETDYDLINKRVDGTSYAADKPLKPGSYTVKVEAFNANDRKLSQSSDDMKFSVK